MKHKFFQFHSHHVFESTHMSLQKNRDGETMEGRGN